MATEQLAKASSHYLKAQVKWRVLGPWKRFIEEMRSKYREAEHQRAKLLSQRALLLWHKRMLQREKERERVAVRHYESFLLTKMLAAWIKVCDHGIMIVYTYMAVVDLSGYKWLSNEVFS